MPSGLLLKSYLRAARGKLRAVWHADSSYVNGAIIGVTGGMPLN